MFDIRSRKGHQPRFPSSFNLQYRLTFQQPVQPAVETYLSATTVNVSTLYSPHHAPDTPMARSTCGCQNDDMLSIGQGEHDDRSPEAREADFENTRRVLLRGAAYQATSFAWHPLALRTRGNDKNRAGSTLGGVGELRWRRTSRRRQDLGAMCR